MLRFTQAEIDLIHDQEMSDLIRHNIRGGLSYINTRAVGEGSPLEGYESDLFHQVLLYLDENVSRERDEIAIDSSFSFTFI